MTLNSWNCKAVTNSVAGNTVCGALTYNATQFAAGTTLAITPAASQVTIAAGSTTVPAKHEYDIELVFTVDPSQVSTVCSANPGAGAGGLNNNLGATVGSATAVNVLLTPAPGTTNACPPNPAAYKITKTRTSQRPLAL